MWPNARSHSRVPRQSLNVTTCWIYLGCLQSSSVYVICFGVWWFWTILLHSAAVLSELLLLLVREFFASVIFENQIKHVLQFYGSAHVAFSGIHGPSVVGEHSTPPPQLNSTICHMMKSFVRVQDTTLGYYVLPIIKFGSGKRPPSNKLFQGVYRNS